MLQSSATTRRSTPIVCGLHVRRRRLRARGTVCLWLVDASIYALGRAMSVVGVDALLTMSHPTSTHSEIKQKNEGGWEFFWDEESRPGTVVLEVRVARHLDSSLIDVDVHPSYVSIVIKGKVGLYDCVTLFNRSLQVDMML